MSTEPAHLIILCTCPDADTAAEIARTLVEERLAACVNTIGPVTSSFRWEGKLTQERELLLLLKIRAEVYPRLERRLADLHPYELPEILAVPIFTGNPAYLAWLDANLD